MILLADFLAATRALRGLTLERIAGCFPRPDQAKAHLPGIRHNPGYWLLWALEDEELAPIAEAVWKAAQPFPAAQAMPLADDPEPLDDEASFDD